MVGWFAFSILLLVTVIGIENYAGGRRLRDLAAVDPLDADNRPRVSVIIAARNEEETIASALDSVLALEYDPLEIIVLDDRSDDATGPILDRMQERHDRLRIVHITDLPQGWLGKCHALHLGASLAKGEYLLFTDADVHMAPDTLGRAMNRMRQEHLDHLCLIFRPTVTNPLLAMLMVDSLTGLTSVLKPWRAADVSSRYFFGVGAFNLLRADLYHNFGGHRPIRLCPVDDILLGRLVKENGGRQECMNGRDFIAVPWYRSVGQMIQGLRKNIFAAIDYRVSRLFLATVVIICLYIVPFWGLVFANGMGRFLFGLTVMVTAGFYLVGAATLGVPLRCVSWFLVTPYLKLYMMWDAVITTLIRGGIDWRGTFYSLQQLKRNMVPLWPWQKR